MDINRLTSGTEAVLPMPLQTAFFDKVSTTEAAQDFVLPDYQPEIRKMLRVTPILTPPSRFLGAGEAEFAGNIEMNVLYMGADGMLYSAPLSLPYELRVPFEGDERFAGGESLSVEADMTPDTVIARVLGPRKLNVRVRLRARVVGRCSEDISVQVDMSRTGVGGGTGRAEPLQKLEKTYDCAVIVCGDGEAVELTDSFPPDTPVEELRLIESRAQALVTEAAVTDEGIACRGEVYLKVLYTGDTAGTWEVESTVRRLPFSVTVPLPTDVAGNTGEACAYADCTALSCRVEDGKMLCAVSVLPHARLTRTDKLTFVSDCYSVERHTDCEFKSRRYLRPLISHNGNMTHTASFALADVGLPAGALPFDTTADVSSVQISVDRGRLVLEGDCHYTTLWRQSDGETGSCEYHLPLRYELPGDGARMMAEGTSLEAQTHLTLLNSRVRGEGEKISLDAEWAICAAVYLPGSVTSVATVEMGEALPESGTAYIICFPEKGDSLWSVAKRYHAPLRALASANALTGALPADDAGSLEGAGFIMI